jgi:hypothetical protein
VVKVDRSRVEAARFDQKIERDAAAGKLGQLADETITAR